VQTSGRRDTSILLSSALSIENGEWGVEKIGIQAAYPMDGNELRGETQESPRRAELPPANRAFSKIDPAFGGLRLLIAREIFCRRDERKGTEVGGVARTKSQKLRNLYSPPKQEGTATEF
jgi:hypothetical protein